MNYGHTKINKYREQPITLVKHIFCLQQRHNLIMNKTIYDADNALLNGTEQLNGAPRSWKNVNSLVAAKKLAF